MQNALFSKLFVGPDSSVQTYSPVLEFSLSLWILRCHLHAPVHNKITQTINISTFDSRYLDFAYLEYPLISKRKSGSLLKKENLRISNKILWKRGGAISPLFHNIVNISLTSGVKLHTHLLNVVARFIFPKFCKSDMSRYGYLEVLLGIRDNESRPYCHERMLLIACADTNAQISLRIHAV